MISSGLIWPRTENRNPLVDFVLRRFSLPEHQLPSRWSTPSPPSVSPHPEWHKGRSDLSELGAQLFSQTFDDVECHPPQSRGGDCLQLDSDSAHNLRRPLCCGDPPVTSECEPTKTCPGAQAKSERPTLKCQACALSEYRRGSACCSDTPPIPPPNNNSGRQRPLLQVNCQDNGQRPHAPECYQRPLTKPWLWAKVWSSLRQHLRTLTTYWPFLMQRTNCDASAHTYSATSAPNLFNDAHG